MNEILRTMKERSSTRGYTDEKLTKEELDTILEAGLMAPTGCNRQEIHFTVVEGDNPVLDELNEHRNRLKGVDKAEHNFYYEAPTLIVLSADRGFKWSVTDAGIAVQNMALAAESLGLGNLIIGCISDAMKSEKAEYYAKAFDFPEGYEFEVAIAVGHKAMNKAPHTYDKEKQVSYVR